MFGAILKFDVKSEFREAFIQALVEHGHAAVPAEPHTLRFDVIADQDDPNLILLYEAYADTEALGVHLAGESHQRLVRTLSEHDWLTMPLAGPPRPFAPFFVGRGDTALTAEEARSSSP